jgi:adenosylcobinamide-GDP ribazoletransferase
VRTTVAGLRLAFTTLTVLPLRPGTVDRRIGAVAMALAPLVGLSLGAALAGAAWCLDRIGFAPLPIAAVLVVLVSLSTRGLHLDGLADTVDALGSYRDRDRALAIMKSPEVGPMGVAAVCLVLVVEVAALTTLVAQHAWLPIVVGLAIGRLAITVCCSRGVPSARPDGLGALVAGTVPVAIPLIWTDLLTIAAVVVTDRHWTGAAAAAATLTVVLVLLWHVCRRLGGITGDVLGAACEIATALGLLVLSAG